MKYASILFNDREIAQVICADKYILRLRGLIGRKIDNGQGLILSPCHQIHTFFMKYSIDAIYLDQEYRILRIDSAITPGKTYKSEKHACHVVELTANSAKTNKLKPGDILSFCIAAR